LKEIRRPAQRATVDYLDAEKWGLSPEGGFKWTVPDDVSAEKISENEGKTHVPSEGAGSENSGISENSLGFDNSKFSENSGIVQNSENSVIVSKYRKLTPERKAEFLEKLSQTGRITLSALIAGVSTGTISDHRKKDPDFDYAVTCAEQLYHEMVAASITAQAMHGMRDIRRDKEGNIIAERVTYEQQIRLAMLKRADPAYVATEKSETKVSAGVVAIPLPQESTESWDDIVKKYTEVREDI
jgi:hypothetical protein